MNILIVTPYFYPEKGAPQTRLLDYSLDFIKAGHNVVVLTAMPNYPRGIVFDQYKKKFFVKEEFKGIRIHRIWTFTSQKKNFFSRILNQVSFAFMAILPGLRIKNIDLIFVESPPLFDGIIGVVLSFFKKIPFVFNVADIWPQAAIELNILNNLLFIKMAEKLERYIYKKAEKVLIVTPGWYELLKSKGLSEAKLKLITNGVNIDFFKPSGKREEFRKKFHFSDNFVIFFGGNHGLAQGLDILVKSGIYLRDFPDIRIVLMGDGPLKNDLIKLKNDLKLDNVEFRDSSPLNEVPHYLEAADAAAVTLKNIPLMEGWIPVKLYEAMAMEKPVVANLKGDTEKIIKESEAGICVKPENPESLAKAIIELKENKNQSHLKGKKGREYIVKNFNRCSIVESLLSIFEKIMNQG